MRKLVLIMHSSFDGFVAGPCGEMDWLTVNESMFDFVHELTQQADTALYGRKTYEIMDNYWPSAGEMPNASKHDKDHSTWYKTVTKLVVSKTLAGETIPGTIIISNDPVAEIKSYKNTPGKNILMLGSPSLISLLTNENLIDEYFLFVNAVLIGKGIPLFNNISEKINFTLMESRPFPGNVVCLHYMKN